MDHEIKGHFPYPHFPNTPHTHTPLLGATDAQICHPRQGCHLFQYRNWLKESSSHWVDQRKEKPQFIISVCLPEAPGLAAPLHGIRLSKVTGRWSFNSYSGTCSHYRPNASAGLVPAKIPFVRMEP